MKIALVHDYIKEYGGAERVLEALHEIWPQAPVYTTVYLPEFLGPHRKRFEDWNIIPSRLQNIPFIHKLISPVRLFTTGVFQDWDFSEFDIVLVSATGAYFPNMIVTKSPILHICYCHTPPRYLYGYPTARNWQKHALGRLVGGFFNHSLRQTDFVSYQSPDYIIANSIEVKKRIQKFYRRDSSVIYPPVEVVKNKEQRTKNKMGQYYLTGGRLARAKRTDLIIEACNRLKLPLKIFGRAFADYGEELKSIAGPTIEFVGEIDDHKLVNLYQNARALLYASEYEDFGIVPVEAQGFGVPVIGLGQGGVKETVSDGRTGILFDEPTVEGLIKAIKRFQMSNIRHQDCIANAKKYNKERFKKEIKRLVEKMFKEQKIKNK